MADTPKERNARYYQNNKAKVTARNKAYREANPHIDRQVSKGYYDRNPEKRLLRAAKKRAKDKGMAFDLTVEDVVIPERCPVFGMVLVTSQKGRSHASPSLDRIDNSKGYVKGNVIVVSWRANHLKSDATLDELRKLVAFYEAQA